MPLVVDPAPTRAAAPVGRAAQSMPLATTADATLSTSRPNKANSQPIEVESSERVNNSSIVIGESDVNASPVSISPESNADDAMLRLCWVGGKRADSSGQRQVQLARLKDARVEIFADYKPSTALVFLPERLVWYLRMRIPFFVLHIEN